MLSIRCAQARKGRPPCGATYHSARPLMLDPNGMKQTGIRRGKAEVIREPRRAWRHRPTRFWT